MTDVMDSDNLSIPSYGEVWLVNAADPHGNAGAWPAVVVSSDAMKGMPWRLVARIEGHRSREFLWRVEVPEIGHAGIDRRSVVDTFQLHCVELAHCIRKLGRLPADCMTEVAAAIAIIVEYEV